MSYTPQIPNSLRAKRPTIVVEMQMVQWYNGTLKLLCVYMPLPSLVGEGLGVGSVTSKPQAEYELQTPPLPSP